MIKKPTTNRMARMVDTFYIGKASLQSISTTDSPDFNSSHPIMVPRLMITAPADGDFVAHTFLGVKCSRNTSMVLSFGVNGEEDKDSVTPVFVRRNRVEGISIPYYRMNDIKKGDIITTNIDTNRKDCDLVYVRRITLTMVWA
jgi:hypothetical protein